MANDMYEAATHFKYNVQLKLVAQVTFAMGNPFQPPACSASFPRCDPSRQVNHTVYLDQLSAWRGSHIGTSALPEHDNTVLLSHLDFAGTVIG